MKEKKALKTLVKKFSAKMKTKVLAKLYEGYGGWDNPGDISYMYKQLNYHVKKCDWVDVANIAMFLENFEFSSLNVLERKEE